MAKIDIIITDAGLAEIVNAENNGTAPVVLAEVGFGTGQYTPSASQTALTNEIKRIDAISGGGAGDNILHLTAEDSSADAYTVYEIGIYTESGTLFAVCSQKSPIITKAAASQALLALDIALTNVNPASVTVGDTNFVLNPATTEREGVIELATEAEVKAGTDATRAVTPATLKAAIPHDDLVHRSGNETIAGTKSFTSAVVLKDGTGEANASLKLPNDTGMIRIVAGNSGFVSGGGFLAMGKSSPKNPGKFYCRAVDGTNVTIDLIGSPDGSLLWNGKNIVRSINGKNADANGNITPAQTGCLPLTGGTMTGSIYSASADECLNICGGETVADGAYIRVDSKNNATPGVFSVVANDGTTTKTLLGKPDGTLMWDGKYITLQGDCLPVSGGTMTGNIYSASTNENITICGGETVADGAYLRLDSKDSTTPGVVRVVANDGTNTKALRLEPDGSATWDEKNIVRSVNGNLADDSGNVDVGGMHIGMIFPYPGATPPAGAYLLNGQIIENCDELYPQFWEWLNTADIRKISNDLYETYLAEYGFCGAFCVWDDTGKVRLPTYTNAFLMGGDSTNVGFDVAAGLPNITGTIGSTVDGLSTGAFAYLSDGGATYRTGAPSVNHSFDASRSSAIYGNSDTVQPPAIRVSWCIQVFNAATELSEQESAQLASKMQTYLPLAGGNITGDLTVKGKDVWFPPNWSGKTNKSIGTTYTAERDGYIMAHSQTQQNVFLVCKINSVEVYKTYMHGGAGGWHVADLSLPISAGDTYNVYLTGDNTTPNSETTGKTWCHFVPVK